jgi:Ser/Thr protein kinase RdoA (MazF antagonist)
MHCALFDLPCPQKIGSIIERDNVAVAGCLIVISPVAPSAPFDDISSYISWLFADMRASKKMGDTPADKEASEHVLKRVEKILPSILKTSPCLQRFVLSHRDLRPPNILITSDVRSFAVIDWEFHAILPACLMAEYPTWIRYDGVLDPKFICTAPNTVHYWEETELAASELRAIYDKVRIFEVFAGRQRLIE